MSVVRGAEPRPVLESPQTRIFETACRSSKSPLYVNDFYLNRETVLCGSRPIACQFLAAPPAFSISVVPSIPIDRTTKPFG